MVSARCPSLGQSRAKRREVGGGLVWVEAQPGTLAGPEADRAELLGVFVDPRALNTPPLGDLRGREQPSR